MSSQYEELDVDGVSKIDGANSVIKTHIIASLTLGLVPVPLFDVAALTATQMNMLRSLSELYDIPFDDADIKPMLMALVGGSLPVISLMGLSSAIKMIPGIGTLIGSASLAVTAGALTYAFGQVFVMHFESGGTFEDFDAKQAKAFFEREFEAGKAFVEEIKKEIKNPDMGAPQSASVADKTTSGVGTK